MGYSDHDGLTIGDWPLDLTRAYLSELSEDYVDEIGRKPTLPELLKTIEWVLARDVDLICSGCDRKTVTGLSAKTKAKPKRQELHPGDVFAVPLGDGTFGYGRVSPLFMYFEFFQLRTRRLAAIAQIMAAKPLPIVRKFFTHALQQGRWRIIGHVDYDRKKFKPPIFQTHFGGPWPGGGLAEEFKESNGFVHGVSSERDVPLEEWKRYPSGGIKVESDAEDELRKLKVTRLEAAKPKANKAKAKSPARPRRA